MADPQQAQQDSFTPITVQAPNTQDSFTPLDPQKRALGLGIPTQPGPQSTPTSLDPALNRTIDFLRPMISGAAGSLAAAGTSLIPGVGQSGVANLAAETQGYAGVDSILKYLKTNPPNSYGESLADSEKDAVVNAVGGRIVGSMFRGAKSFLNSDTPEIYKFAPTTSAAAESYGYHRLATAAKFAEDFGAAGSKAEALDKAGGAGFTQSLKFVNAINGRMAGTNMDPVKLADKIREDINNTFTPTPSRGNAVSQEALDTLSGGSNPFAKIDQVIQDPDRLSKVLAVSQVHGTGTNVRQDLQGYQFMRMINDAATRDSGTVTRLDPKKISAVWDDPDMKTSLDTLWGKQGRQNVTDFLKNIQTTQQPQNSYLGKRAAWLMSGGVVMGGLTEALTGNIGAAAAGTVGMYIPLNIMGRLLTKPTIGRAIVAMAGSEPLTDGKQFLAKQIFSALQGSSVALLGPDGKKTWGQFQYNSKTGQNEFVEAR